MIMFIAFSLPASWIIDKLLETIVGPRGLTSEQAGIVGAVFVIAGIIGAVVLPILSDKYAVRRPFFVGAIGILLPSLVGLTYVDGLLLLSIIAAIAGFSIMGVAPILFQQGSESAYPVQEGASLGMILLMGQVSGAAFVYLFETAAGSMGSIVWPMLAFVIMTAAMLPLASRIRDSRN